MPLWPGAITHKGIYFSDLYRKIRIVTVSCTETSQARTSVIWSMHAKSKAWRL
jgi:hypothetical protein